MNNWNMKKVPFITALKKMKRSGRNPLKHAWDLHAENYKRIIKESKADPCK